MCVLKAQKSIFLPLKIFQFEHKSETINDHTFSAHIRHNIYIVEVSVDFGKFDLNSQIPAITMCHMCAYTSKKIFEHKKYVKRICYHMNMIYCMYNQKYRIEISAECLFLPIFQLIFSNFKYSQNDQFLSYRNAYYEKASNFNKKYDASTLK